MPMTLSGDGTITGLAAGGLPDASITAAELSGAQNGSAPIYGARAWVNFNGTGTVAIRASGNVSSITDNGTGDYTVNFTTAMSDANYSTVTSCGRNGGSGGYLSLASDRLAQTASAVQLYTITNLAVLTDTPIVFVSIFR
jgi:hypothetical protein